MTKSLGLGERKSLLGGIIETLQTDNATGKLDWANYFKVHPEHAAQLGYAPGTVSKLWNANNMLARFLMKKAAKSRIQNHPANVKALAPYRVNTNGNGKEESRVKWTEADYKLASSIAAVYKISTRNGKESIRWDDAWTAHPEWYRQLNKSGDKALSAFLSRVRQRMQKGTLTAPEPVAEPKAAAPEPTPTPSIQYCPGCGLNLMMFQKAFTIAMKHSAKD